MTTEQNIALAKEKLGRDITEQEARDYIDGKAVIPDEALDLVSGGVVCIGTSGGADSLLACPRCGSFNVNGVHDPNTKYRYLCSTCGYEWMYTTQ